MNINSISKESTKEIIDIIIDDRLLEIKRLLEEDILKDGDEFILTEIFSKDDWNGIQHYPGNWSMGREFKMKLNKSELPVFRHPDGKLKDRVAVYIVKKN